MVAPDGESWPDDDYDIAGPQFRTDPHQIYALLRDSKPVAVSHRWGGSVMPTRYADIVAVARSAEDYSLRERLMVQLVDTDGVTIGESTVEAAHRMPGLPHRAFSVVVRDPAGRILLQQRSAEKTRFPLRWANTCCGHPAPGRSIAAAAAQRLSEELGLAGGPIVELGVHVYRAEDVTTGRVEHEYDHVLLMDLVPGSEPDPDPAEVASIRWMLPDELAADLAERPEWYSPWVAGVLSVVQGHVAPR